MWFIHYRIKTWLKEVWASYESYLNHVYCREEDYLS